MNIDIFYEEEQSLYEEEERREEDVEVEQDLESQLSVHDGRCLLFGDDVIDLFLNRSPGAVIDICKLSLASSAAFPCLFHYIERVLILDFACYYFGF